LKPSDSDDPALTENVMMFEELKNKGQVANTIPVGLKGGYWCGLRSDIQTFSMDEALQRMN
jgi:hypothetical protein